VAKAPGIDALPNTYIGDRRQGCMCTYLMMQPQAQPKRLKNKQAALQAVATSDVFESATGSTSAKYMCHRALTRATPVPIESPEVYPGAPDYDFCRLIMAKAKRIALEVFRFIVPKFQFGIGVNLFRVGP
jgi:hypothetical protein